MLKLCKNFHGLVQKVLQSVAEFVPTRENKVLVLISLESPCFARFRPGEHDVSKTLTLSLFLLCFRKEYFVFFTKLYILFQNAANRTAFLVKLIGSIFANLYLETRH